MSTPPKKLTGLVQPPLERPAPQLPSPVVCSACRKVVAASAAVRNLFGALVCASGCGAPRTEAGPGPGH